MAYTPKKLVYGSILCQCTGMTQCTWVSRLLKIPSEGRAVNHGKINSILSLQVLAKLKSRNNVYNKDFPHYAYRKNMFKLCQEPVKGF